MGIHIYSFTLKVKGSLVLWTNKSIALKHDVV